MTEEAIPRRWLVLGAGRAGKTRFAEELGRILGLPLIHLDQHYWHPGWIESPRDEWTRRVVELSAGEEWVMDGNYSRTLELRLAPAEAAVLLDAPTWQCIWGIYARTLLHRGRVRPDLAEGCEEQLPDRKFLWYVATYKRRSRPKVLRRVAAAPHVRLYHLESRRQARAFLEEMQAVVQPVRRERPTRPG